jgi:acyl phosphate:glycerol-3-phosphate acyltransferase
MPGDHEFYGAWGKTGAMSDIGILNDPTPFYIGAAIVGYLLGAIPFGVILTRFAGLGDIRAIGSGNIGATNVLRTGHKTLALLTLIGDALKGTAAVLLTQTFGQDVAIVAGLFAFLGHLFPVWLRFKGGKGVATYLGVLLGLSWPVAIIFAVVWLTGAFITRYSSIGALAASLVTAPVLFFYGETRLAGLFVVLTVLLWIRHAQNIQRLIAGTETRIGQGG